MGFALLALISPLSWYALWVLTRKATRRLFGLTEAGSWAGVLQKLGLAVFGIVAILVNLGEFFGAYQAITGPSTRPIPISELAGGVFMQPQSCGIDAYGKLTSTKPVTVEGLVGSVAGSTFVIEEAGAAITVVVNREFPLPLSGQKLQLMGYVQCLPAGSFAGNIFHEITRRTIKEFSK